MTGGSRDTGPAGVMGHCVPASSHEQQASSPRYWHEHGEPRLSSPHHIGDIVPESSTSQLIDTLPRNRSQSAPTWRKASPGV